MACIDALAPVPPLSIHGFRLVSKDEFFATVGQMNVHPSVRDETRASWEKSDRTVMGISYPGWKYPYGSVAWFVHDSIPTSGAST